MPVLVGTAHSCVKAFGKVLRVSWSTVVAGTVAHFDEKLMWPRDDRPMAMNGVIGIRQNLGT